MAHQGEVVVGDDALVAAADLLYRALRGSKLSHFFHSHNVSEVAVALRHLLTQTFQGEPWPHVRLGEYLFHTITPHLVAVVQVTLKRPLPLGEDPLASAIEVAVHDLATDVNMVAFYQGIRNTALTEQELAERQSRERSGSVHSIPTSVGLAEDFQRDKEAVLSRAGSAVGDLLAVQSAAGSGEMPVIHEDKPEHRSGETPAGAAVGEVEEPHAAHHHDTSHASMVQEAEECEINVTSLEEPKIPIEIVQAVQKAWNTFIGQAPSKDAAGEAIYSAIFDAAPSLQPLFKTPRAVMAMRFMNGNTAIINALHEPARAFTLIETLAFQHLELEVTVPRIILFRDAILELFDSELSPDIFDTVARSGLGTVLSYAGGAFVYTRVKFADRLRIIASSWAIANNKKVEVYDEGGSLFGSGEAKEELAIEKPSNLEGPTTASSKKSGWGLFNNIVEKASGEATGKGDVTKDQSKFSTNIPTTFNEMFQFNAAVMGFAGNLWMQEVLASFDTIVTNVSNSGRLQEECDVLSLRMAKCTNGPVNLGEFKAVMMASLRSLVPKDWNSAHEVAWNWLWENVERMLKILLGKPSLQLHSLEKLYAGLQEDQLVGIRKGVYTNFFTLAPAGQDFFKQSSTRLNFIADRVLEFTTDIFKDPVKMVNTLSALGLRHVGYGIPTELFGAFVTGAIECVREFTDDLEAVEAFRWSLGLVSRILVRTINEGSTIVMKAINANSASMLRKAVSCAPRGQRSTWMLNITVGTQFISPLLWAIESGSWEAAKAIFLDLLTIRADRDRYYYGADELFERHPDIIRILAADAPALLPSLLDGLLWRSRLAIKGYRRVNYYVKHLVITDIGSFNHALEWLAKSGDPKIICHPVVSFATDTIWSGIAYETFLRSKVTFLLAVILYVLSQAILERTNGGHPTIGARWAVFLIRIFIYVLNFGGLLLRHGALIFQSIKQKDFFAPFGVPMPGYLKDWKNCISAGLCGLLGLMLIYEPVFRCFTWGSNNNLLLTSECPDTVGDNLIKLRYSVWSMLAMLCYFSLLMDLTVFSNRISAFVLVCGYLLGELSLYLAALAFWLLAMACGLSALQQRFGEFKSIPDGMLSLFEMSLTMFRTEYYLTLDEEPVLMIVLILFMIIIGIFLLNLLIAQLNTAYEHLYKNMVGYARLNRTRIIAESMPTVPPPRWNRFVASLELDARLEFNEGDIGFAGGIQVLEPASANVTTVDTIKRVGGSTSPAMQWPEEEDADSTQDDRFDRIERMIGRALKRVNESGRKKKGGGSRSGASGSGGGSTGGGGSQSKVSGGGSEGGGSDGGGD